jgi:hypothetical protein
MAAANFPEPVGGWKTLKDMHADYVETIRRVRGARWPIAVWESTKADWCFDPETSPISVPILRFPSRGANPSPEEYSSARIAMVEAAITGEWFAIGRRVGKRSIEQLIPPGYWKSLRPNIDTGTAGWGALRYEDLRCADTLLAKPSLQKIVKDALDESELVKNGQPGRPSLMTFILPELDRRIRSGQLLPTCAAEARYLVNWLKSAHPKAPCPGVGGVKNAIGDAYRAAKAAPTNKRTKF